MRGFDLYGFESDDLTSLRRSIEVALGVDLEAHESSYRCGTYYRYGLEGEEHLILQRNFDSMEREWTEEAFRGSLLLLYVNETRRGEEIRRLLNAAIPGLKLLRRDEFDG